MAYTEDKTTKHPRRGSGSNYKMRREERNNHCKKTMYSCEKEKKTKI